MHTVRESIKRTFPGVGQAHRFLRDNFPDEYALGMEAGRLDRSYRRYEFPENFKMWKPHKRNAFLAGWTVGFNVSS